MEPQPLTYFYGHAEKILVRTDEICLNGRMAINFLKSKDHSASFENAVRKRRSHKVLPFQISLDTYSVEVVSAHFSALMRLRPRNVSSGKDCSQHN